MGPFKTLERAERAMAQNKARLEATGSAGLASDKTLGSRGYEPGPDGEGPRCRARSLRRQANESAASAAESSGPRAIRPPQHSFPGLELLALDGSRRAASLYPARPTSPFGTPYSHRALEPLGFAALPHLAGAQSESLTVSPCRAVAPKTDPLSTRIVPGGRPRAGCQRQRPSGASASPARTLELYSVLHGR